MRSVYLACLLVTSMVFAEPPPVPEAPWGYDYVNRVRVTFDYVTQDEIGGREQKLGPYSGTIFIYRGHFFPRLFPRIKFVGDPGNKVPPDSYGGMVPTQFLGTYVPIWSLENDHAVGTLAAVTFTIVAPLWTPMADLYHLDGNRGPSFPTPTRISHWHRQTATWNFENRPSITLEVKQVRVPKKRGCAVPITEGVRA